MWTKLKKLQIHKIKKNIHVTTFFLDDFSPNFLDKIEQIKKFSFILFYFTALPPTSFVARLQEVELQHPGRTVASSSLVRECPARRRPWPPALVCFFFVSISLLAILLLSIAPSSIARLLALLRLWRLLSSAVCKLQQQQSHQVCMHLLCAFCLSAVACLLLCLCLLRVWLIELGKRNLGSGAALESANCSEFRFGLERGTNFVREWRIAVLWVYNAGCGLTKELRFGLCLPCKEEGGVLHTKLWDWRRFYQVARGSGTLSSLPCPFAHSESPERSEFCSILPSVSVDISLFLYISCIFRSSANTSFALNSLCCGCKS